MGEHALPSPAKRTPHAKSNCGHRPFTRIHRALLPVIVPRPILILLFLPTSCSPSYSPSLSPSKAPPSPTLAIRIVVPLIERTPDIPNIPNLDFWPESAEVERGHSDRSDEARAGGGRELAVEEVEEVGGERVGVGVEGIWGGWGVGGVEGIGKE